MSGIEELTVFVSDEESERIVDRVVRTHKGTRRIYVRALRHRDREYSHLKVAGKTSGKRDATDGPYFILSALSRLADVADIASEANRRNKLKGLLIRDEGTCTTNEVLHSMSEASIRILRNVLVHKGVEVPRRVVAAWADGVQEETIADAYGVTDGLAVYDCSMRRFEMSYDQLRTHFGMAAPGLREFEVDDDGSFLYWPELDLHVNLEMIREATDPAFKARRIHTDEAHLRRYGRAIAALRKKHGLRQSDFTGLSERHLRRIESGAPVNQAVLQALASGHRMTLEAYLDILAVQLREEIA